MRATACALGQRMGGIRFLPDFFFPGFGRWWLEALGPASAWARADLLRHTDLRDGIGPDGPCNHRLNLDKGTSIMREIGIGLIGTGFMGKAHAFAYRAVAGIYPDSLRPVLQAVADVNGPAAEKAASQFGFRRSLADWRVLVADPEVEMYALLHPGTPQ